VCGRKGKLEGGGDVCEYVEKLSEGRIEDEKEPILRKEGKKF
jgi:hypothetical protein